MEGLRKGSTFHQVILNCILNFKIFILHIEKVIDPNHTAYSDEWPLHISQNQFPIISSYWIPCYISYLCDHPVLSFSHTKSYYRLGKNLRVLGNLGYFTVFIFQISEVSHLIFDSLPSSTSNPVDSSVISYILPLSYQIDDWKLKAGSSYILEVLMHNHLRMFQISPLFVLKLKLRAL